MCNSEFSNTIIKRCPCCGMQFSFFDILNQSFIKPIGITLFEDNPEMSLFMFNHECKNCHTTFAIPAKDFSAFIDEDIPEKILANLPECEGHCLDIEDQSICSQNCLWAPFRQFMNQLVEEKKKAILPAVK